MESESSLFENMIKCEICGQEFQNNRFRSHLAKEHFITEKNYYLKCIDESFHECMNPSCHAEAKFLGVFKGYNLFCSQSCANTVSTTKRHKTHPRFNREKADKTNLERYGFTCTMCNESVRMKRKITIERKYGADSPMKNEYVKMKAKKSRFGKNNGDYFSKETLDKMKQTNLERYGVDNPFKSDEVKAKIKETNLKRYGVRIPTQNHDMFCKSFKRYFIDGVKFDSKPEIEWYQKLKEYFTDFEYQPKVFFEYQFDGKTYRYFPDFKVGNVIYELKGAHFFKDGEMINPYNPKDNEKIKAKFKCMVDNNVKIVIVH